jgi:uncharacterized Zn-binding protein involved in type VI secretion
MSSGAVCRIGDLSDLFRTCTQDFAATGSPDVLVNGIPVHRRNDLWTVHCCRHGNCYDAFLLAGAPTTFANGLAIGRVDDPIMRYRKISGNEAFRKGTSKVKTGSPNTFISVGSAGQPNSRTVFFRAGAGRAGDAIQEVIIEYPPP